MFVTDNMIDEMAARYGSPSIPKFDIPTKTKELDFIRSTQKRGRNHDVTIYAIKNKQVVVIAKHFYPPDLYRAPSGGLNPGESFHEGIAREMAEEIGCVIELERFLLHTSVRFVNSELQEYTPSSEQAPQPPLLRGVPTIKSSLRKLEHNVSDLDCASPKHVIARSEATKQSHSDFVSGRQTSRSAPDKLVEWRSFVFLARVVSGDFKFTDTHEIKEVRLADWSDFEVYSRIMRASNIAGLHYRAQLHDAVLGAM